MKAKGFKPTLQWFLRYLLIISLGFVSNGCFTAGAGKNKVIRIKGSDTMLTLNRLWAEAFMRENSGISVYVEGGGTATGMAALIKGNIEICAASRSINPAENRELADAYQSLSWSYLVARDALSIYVNLQNPVNNLTMPQLRGIFAGTIRNWQAVGGVNSPIKVMIRPPNSGSYAFVKKFILEDSDYLTAAAVEPTNRSVSRAVSQDPAAIGYGGIAYGDSLRHCKIDGIAPNEATIQAEAYPLSRYLYFYTVKAPRGPTKKFLDWVLSARGQKIVREAGYVPVWAIPE